jgi:dTDP-4-dehydrorhamnose reductase
VPRRTALATVAAELASNGSSHHPALDGEGWWRSRSRFSYPSHRVAPHARILERQIHSRRPILITGAGGTLGRAFARICAERGLEHRALSRADLDIASPRSVDAAIDEIAPWAIINAAGYVRVDDAEWYSASCRRANTDGALTLGRACAARGIRLLSFSTDLVFDGESDRPYVESAAVNPLSVYGTSKADAERELLKLDPQPLVVRTSAFFGPWDSYNFLATTFASIAAGIPVAVADDAVVSPTYVPDLVNASLDLLIDDERGIWHLANPGAVSWLEFGRLAATAAGLDADLIIGEPTHALGLTARRPRYSALTSERGSIMPPLTDAIVRYVAECANNFHAAPAAVNG